MHTKENRRYIATGQGSTGWTSFKDRDEWIRIILTVNSDELSYTAKIVGIRIALHHNVETGRCDPNLATLAAGTGMSDRNVRRMLRELEHSGWLRVDSRGFHRSNSFELLVPESEQDRTTVSAQRPDTVVRSDDVRPDNPGTMTGQAGYQRPDTVVRQKREKNSEEKSEEDRLSPRLDLGDEDSRRRDQADSSTSTARAKAMQAKLDAASGWAAHRGEFERWWTQYPKKTDKVAALKAYCSVVRKKLATSAELLAGAVRYAGERNGQDPRYTKNPATWLNAGSWSNETVMTTTAPTSGTVIDQDGNPVQQPPPWQQKRNTERCWADAVFGGRRS